MSVPDLKHREVNDTVIDLAKREPCPSDTLELCPIFVKITEGLISRLKCRLESAHLPNGTYREHERNCLAGSRLGLRCDPHTRHVIGSSVGTKNRSCTLYLGIVFLRLFAVLAGRAA